jgi:hypothetical protein
MKSEADRYLHYFNRYFLHETAGKSVPQLRLKALEKQQQYRELTSGNPDFLIEAVDLLAKVRSHDTTRPTTNDTTHSSFCSDRFAFVVSAVSSYFEVHLRVRILSARRLARQGLFRIPPGTYLPHCLLLCASS